MKRLYVLAMIGLVVFNYTTRSGIIARATVKEAVRQPVFLLLLLLAVIGSGLVTSLAAVIAAVRSPLLEALRAE